MEYLTSVSQKTQGWRNVPVQCMTPEPFVWLLPQEFLIFNTHVLCHSWKNNLVKVKLCLRPQATLCDIPHPNSCFVVPANYSQELHLQAQHNQMSPTFLVVI